MNWWDICWTSVSPSGSPDTAVAEVYSFITGAGLPMLPIDVASKSGEWNPKGSRKMKLWWTHYWLTRRERIETASRIRTELNLSTPPNLADLEALWDERDAGGLPNSEEIVRQIEKPPLPSTHAIWKPNVQLSNTCVRIAATDLALSPQRDDGDRFWNCQAQDTGRIDGQDLHGEPVVGSL